VLFVAKIITFERPASLQGSVARIICVAVATLANEKLLERASDNDLSLCRKSSRIKRLIDNDLIDV
jgi:hypothetical protein